MINRGGGGGINQQQQQQQKQQMVIPLKTLCCFIFVVIVLIIGVTIGVLVTTNFDFKNSSFISKNDSKITNGEDISLQKRGNVPLRNDEIKHLMITIMNEKFEELGKQQQRQHSGTIKSYSKKKKNKRKSKERREHYNGDDYDDDEFQRKNYNYESGKDEEKSYEENLDLTHKKLTIRRGKLPNVKNATSDELISNAHNAIDFKLMFDFMNVYRGTLPEKDKPVCMAYHDIQGYRGSAVNLMTVWRDNNSTVIHAINMVINGKRKGLMISQAVTSIRYPGIERYYQAYETIWGNFIDADLNPKYETKTSSSELDDSNNPEMVGIGKNKKKYVDSRETILRISGKEAVCIQLKLKEMRFDPFE